MYLEGVKQAKESGDNETLYKLYQNLTGAYIYLNDTKTARHYYNLSQRTSHSKTDVSQFMDGFTLALLVKAEGKSCTLGMYAPVQPSRFWQLYGQGHRRECRIRFMARLSTCSRRLRVSPLRCIRNSPWKKPIWHKTYRRFSTLSLPHRHGYFPIVGQLKSYKKVGRTVGHSQNGLIGDAR